MTKHTRWFKHCLLFILLVTSGVLSFQSVVKSVPLEENEQLTDNLTTDNSLEAHDDAAKEFILKYGDQMAELASQNDLYPSVMLAQAIISSDNGRSLLAQPPTNNLFAIKGRYHDQYVASTATDGETGEVVAVEFRQYPSVKDSLQDYVDLMKLGSEFDAAYYQGTWVSRTSSYEEATASLNGTFAMTEEYSEQLNELITMYNLVTYDSLLEKEAETPKEQEDEQAVDSSRYYVLKEGENLWDVSVHLGVSVGELMKQNNLNTSKLSFNQEFFVE